MLVQVRWQTDLHLPGQRAVNTREAKQNFNGANNRSAIKRAVSVRLLEAHILCVEIHCLLRLKECTNFRGLAPEHRCFLFIARLIHLKLICRG
jgi:hypothetical protein